MILDQLFPPAGKKKMVIMRKDGRLFHKAIDVKHHEKNQLAQKPMFPISKNRK